MSSLWPLRSFPYLLQVPAPESGEGRRREGSPPSPAPPCPPPPPSKPRLRSRGRRGSSSVVAGLGLVGEGESSEGPPWAGGGAGGSGGDPGSAPVTVCERECVWGWDQRRWEDACPGRGQPLRPLGEGWAGSGSGLLPRPARTTPLPVTAVGIRPLRGEGNGPALRAHLGR